MKSKVLIVQLGFLGDVILSTPVIGAVREKHPDAEIWMMTTPLAANLLKLDPRLEGIVTFDKRGDHRGFWGTIRCISMIRSYGFDIVYSVHRSFRTSLVLALAGIPLRKGFQEARCSFLYNEKVSRRKNVHDVLRNLSIIDSSYEDRNAPQMVLYPPERENLSDSVSSLIEGISDYIVFVPGSVWPTKRWHWKRYRELAELLQPQKKVILLGAPNEKEICDKVAEGTSVVNLAGKTTIPELLSLIGGASGIVCNDSMALHVASALQVPTVAVFCATSPTFGFGPWSNRAEVVEKEGLHCKPCRRHGSKVCPTGTESCMKDLSAARVYEATQRVFNL